MKSLALSILFFSVFITGKSNFENVIPKTYNFDQKITMTAKSSDEDAVDIDYFFSSKDDSILCMRMNADLEMGSSESIYIVFENDKIEMLMNAAGMKMRKTITKEEFSAFSNLDEIPEQSEITKTGNSKIILGYTCNAYKTTTESGSVTAWVCPNFPIDRAFVPMLGMRKNNPFDGFVMELHTTASTEKANLKITNVDLNATLVLDTSTYKDFKF
ncbi:DUF4412 domain-containing protein [Winogradskyella sp. PG-2]|uniref:DUF4412 domain-containing protein n=1 Tax=Winogradskyella sp. PG-2 TaxID=754409 RepID=UPI00149457D6|nr:DUF4412 domain-containing protein [Winogradskyella sp. PG-2]